MTLFVGVDGGGTHTRAVLVDGAGLELGRAEAGASVVRVDAPELAAGAVVEAVRAAADAVGACLPADALWAGLAGAGTHKARAAVERELSGAGIAKRVVVGTDVEVAFQDAFGGGPGILLIAGTGSIAWTRDAEGRIERVGGWGDRLGDEGSGFAIGLAALRAAVRAEDGRGPRSRLQSAVVEHLGLGGVDDLVPWIATATKAHVASLVPVVSAAARSGDGVAADILDQAVSDLAEHLRAALERGGPWDGQPELALWGGLLQPGGSLRAAMEPAIASLPVRPSDRDLDPAMGAASLARNSRP